MDKKAFRIQAKSVLEQAKIDIAYLKEATKPFGKISDRQPFEDNPEIYRGKLLIFKMSPIILFSESYSLGRTQVNRSVNLAALRSLEDKVRKIEIALGRIDDKDFGICRKCKNKIPEGRLILLPGAVFCVNCAQ